MVVSATLVCGKTSGTGEKHSAFYVPISLDAALVRMLWYQRLPYLVNILVPVRCTDSPLDQALAISSTSVHHISVGASEMNDEDPRLKTKNGLDGCSCNSSKRFEMSRCTNDGKRLVHESRAAPKATEYLDTPAAGFVRTISEEAESISTASPPTYGYREQEELAQPYLQGPFPAKTLCTPN